MRVKNERKKVDLQRTLSVWGGIALTVGTMIGSGIFISPKSVLRYNFKIEAELFINTRNSG